MRIVSMLIFVGVFVAGSIALAVDPPVGGTLNIYIWDQYLPKDVLDNFTKQTGVRVTVDNYDSNETLLAKLGSGVAAYDIVVPSDYVIQPLTRQKLIRELDKSKIKNFANLDEHFINQKFDPGNQYSIPYLWGTTGFAYNKKQITTSLDSWDALFDPKYSGKILMLDDMRECFTIALKKMGKSANETDPEILRQAADLLKRQHPLVRRYDSQNYDNTLAAGDVLIAHGWNGQMAKVVSDRPDDFAYILPKEGGTIWMDNVCIPTAAQHVEAAYAFVNFILEPQNAGAIVNGVNYASPNAAAKQFVDKKILNDKNIYPPTESLKNWEFLDDLGGKTNRMLSQLWQDVKRQ